MNYAYVTVLSTNSYYKGVVALFESLKETNPKYNKFVVIVNETIDNDIVEDLKRRGYIVIVKPKIDASSLVKNTSYAYWVNTFDKLYVFELTQFDKIVYLDSDMYIAKNIDDLFDMPHMSGAISGKERVPDWDGINSGLMVIVPEEGILDKMKNILLTHEFNKDIGDQDIINEYFDWKNKNLAISEKYNLFYYVVDQYVNEFGYDSNDLRVIHYIGRHKPWMFDTQEIIGYRAKCQLEKKSLELKFFDKYMDIIDKI